MLESLSTAISAHLVNKSIIPNEKRDEVAYGLSLLFAAGIITFTIAVIGVVTGTYLQCFVYSLVFLTTRNIVGLLHCNAYYKCFTVSVGLYLGMTIAYIYSTSIIIPFIWLCMAICLLIYKAIEVFRVDSIDARIILMARFRKLCIISVVGAMATIVFCIAGIRAISFPLSYGIFVVSLLFVPETHTTEKEKMS